jgi:hypothetical protein
MADDPRFFPGFFLIWTSDRVLADPRWRRSIAIGFCATYSTCSSHAFETFALFGKASSGLPQCECADDQRGMFPCGDCGSRAGAQHLQKER